MPQKRKKKTSSTRRRTTSLKSSIRRRKKQKSYYDEIEEGIEFGYTAGEIVADIIVGILSIW